MKQSFFNFILFFQRVEEVKIINNRAKRLKVNVDKLSTLTSSDVRTLNNIFRVTSNLKTFYFVKPTKKHDDLRKDIAALEMSMTQNAHKVKNADEAQYLQELARGVADYYRLDEMFEQNSFFWLFIVVALMTIFLPIIFTLWIK